MLVFLAFLMLPALAATGWIQWTRRPDLTAWRTTYGPRVGMLWGLGLFASLPFISTGGLGTSEAYNYSLATADAVTQARAGILPVLVGQSDFAWNGRIHPLRTAPAMPHLAVLLDTLSFRSLNFWALQNLLLALALVSGAFSCYACLRRVAPLSPRVALALTAAYLLSPGALAAAYGQDLYMTVLTLPLLPVALCAALRVINEPKPGSALALLSAALAAAWLTHPPVALWLSFASGVMLIPLVLRPHTWAALLGAALLGGMLAAFVFASVLSIKTNSDLTSSKDVELLLRETARAAAASFQPVSATADQLGDFQLGYLGWALLIGATCLTFLRRRFAGFALLFSAALLLALTLPSGLQAWLWAHAPAITVTLTNQWPMQRTYLLITALVVFACALSYRPVSLARLPKIFNDAITILLLGVLVWHGSEAWKFIGRGLRASFPKSRAAAMHRPENINLTVISYALLGSPPWLVHGVMDPAMEFRLLRPGDAAPLNDNWGAPASTSVAPVADTFNRSGGAGDFLDFSPTLTLQPGQRYRLNFAFTPPYPAGTLQISGNTFRREYRLPTAGDADGIGFSAKPTGRHALSLWTTGDVPETLTLRLAAPELANEAGYTLAPFTFETLDPDTLPVRLDGLVPLQATVRSPGPAYLETPRMFIEGYAATVDGRPVRAQRSPTGLVMFAVPAGESRVTLAYPGPPILRITFWLGVAGWLGLIAAGSTLVFLPASAARIGSVISALRSSLLRHWRPIGAATLALAVVGYGWHRWSSAREAVGAFRIRLVLPRGETNRSQPLLTTGRDHAGTFIFIQYADATHIRVGVDVWGLDYWMSEPIAVDYFAEHEFTISSGALYPPGHPRLKGLSPAQRAALHDMITVDLDGRRVLERKTYAFDSKPSEVTVGLNRIGGSNTEPRFVGKLLHVERLPLPQTSP